VRRLLIVVPKVAVKVLAGVVDAGVLQQRDVGVQSLNWHLQQRGEVKTKIMYRRQRSKQRLIHRERTQKVGGGKDSGMGVLLCMCDSRARPFFILLKPITRKGSIEYFLCCHRFGAPAPTPASECRRAICTSRDGRQIVRGRSHFVAREGGWGGPKSYGSTATLVLIIQYSLYELPP
jgi:hypothetical protein